jgi:intracellular multiplication protein IcmO
VQQLNKGEQITLFQGDVIRGSSLYIGDDDKITCQDIRINRFIEVAAPTVETLMTFMPVKVRWTVPRADAVTRLLAVGLDENKGASSHHHPSHIIITDTVLFAVAQETTFMDEVEDPTPTAVERATRLYSLVAAVLGETRGRYQAEHPQPAKITVKQAALQQYARYHQAMEPEKEPGQK